MVWYGGLHKAIIIALYGGFHLDIIMVWYGGPHTHIIIALYVVSVHWHYKGLVWRAP
jgi:hypothetical protein